MFASEHGYSVILLFSYIVEKSVSVKFGIFGDRFVDCFLWVIPIKKVNVTLFYL